jgi:hypothetical protein
MRVANIRVGAAGRDAAMQAAIDDASRGCGNVSASDDAAVMHKLFHRNLTRRTAPLCGPVYAFERHRSANIRRFVRLRVARQEKP